MSKDNGGPAFPVVGAPGAPEDYPGMTLRDHFAENAPLHDLKFESAQAAAEFSGLPIPTNTDELVAVAMSCAAKAAYIYADAMLAERAK